MSYHEYFFDFLEFGWCVNLVCDDIVDGLIRPKIQFKNIFVYIMFTFVTYLKFCLHFVFVCFILFTFCLHFLIANLVFRLFIFLNSLFTVCLHLVAVCLQSNLSIKSSLGFDQSGMFDHINQMIKLTKLSH
jgi:hypothetical protein